jgi:RecB family endonuclease NucS
VSDAGVDAKAGRRVSEHPTPEDAVEAIEAAADAGHVVSIVGPCAVPMADRHPPTATGEEATTGDYHVLVKPDGAVVVHGGSGTTPIRRFEAAEGPVAAEVEGRLRIGRSAAAGPIEFDRIELVASFDLDDGGERPDAGVDRHGALLDRLLAQPDLVEPGFRPLATSRFGFPDLTVWTSEK